MRLKLLVSPERSRSPPHARDRPQIHLVRLDLIDAEVLVRDRTVTPDGPLRCALISGHRRLTAFHALRHRSPTPEKLEAIPASLRQPASIPAAFAAMVEENEIRAGPSP